jgi:hypothetical protein
MELSFIDELMLTPNKVVKPLTRKQEQIHKTKTWTNSAIVRSKEFKKLRAMYVDLYQKNIAEES